MKPRLIILSDLWGENKSEWIEAYIQRLENNFEIQFYDCCKLGEVSIGAYTEEALHKQFIDSGIETAISALGHLEKERVHILAFSVGGVIGWKYALRNPGVESFVSISSTRLRYETLKPATKIELYFGDNDIYKPNKDWFMRMNLSVNLLSDSGHEVYKNESFINQICSKILSFI